MFPKKPAIPKVIVSLYKLDPVSLEEAQLVWASSLEVIYAYFSISKLQF